MKKIIFGTITTIALIAFTSPAYSDTSSEKNSTKTMKCGSGKCGKSSKKETMKCGAGKCGKSDKKTTMKCGAGKCGGGK